MVQLVKNPLTNTGDTRDVSLIPGWGRFPGVGNGDPLKFLPGESHGERSLRVYSPWGDKESNTTERLSAAEHSTL